jgi:alpha-tubulin suppressor-like RCC1 family protein
MMAAEAARFGLKVQSNFSKKDRAGWTAQEKSMWKTQSQLSGEKKATKFMVKYFAKKNGEPEAKKEPKPDPAALHMAMAASAAAQEPKEQMPKPKSGVMVCAGSLDWVTVGNASIAADKQNNLWGFHRIPAPVQVRSVSSGPSARHVIAIDTDGSGWAWGRNCNGQLGLGDTEPRALPTRITGLPSGCKAEDAACGRHHTLLLAGGTVLSCGGNAAAQLGLGTVGPAEDGPRTKFKKVSSNWAGDASVTGVACGADFSVALSSAGVVASWGHPQYGQLGHGSDGEYIAKQGKTDYNFQKTPLAVDFGKDSGDGTSSVKIDEIACGNNHSVARTQEGAVYTWGFGGYGRLGHRGSARDEMLPRMIEDFDGGPARSSARMVRAGATCCYVVTYKGQTFHWGKTKQQGEAVTRPTPVPDLNGWTVRGTQDCLPFD